MPAVRAEAFRMCLVLLAVDPDGDVPLIVAANRDERHDRPADALAWWSDRPGVLAGRDRVAGGTWFGVGADGRFAAVLNDHRFPPPTGAPSRGGVVPGFLESPDPVARLHVLVAERERYAGFHLLGGCAAGIHYCARVTDAPIVLGPGLHTVDNTGLDIDDPRSARARWRIGSLLEAAGDPESILAALADEEDPGSGGGDRRPIFIRDPVFGTRCSTVLRVDADGLATCHERLFDATGAVSGESSASWQCERVATAVCRD
ncbi:MAG: NRDE family protein [Halofilum sp. (in: g-proteobacteria)]